MNNNPYNSEPYTTYGIDLPGILRLMYEKISGGNFDQLHDTLSGWWTVYSIIAIMFSALCLTGIIYAKIRYAQLRQIEDGNLHAAEKAWANKYAKPESRNARWDLIQRRVTENSPEAWRIAVIEADIMLDETLTNAGYVGHSLGEKLKSANPASFTTIQDAWEAHKVRNEIAHTGSDFVLTKRSAQETITRYERVFMEFGVV